MPRAPVTPGQIAARRDTILDAAAVELAERGYHGATVRRIARRAGLAEGTLYNYFPGKEALLTGLLERLQRGARRKIDLGTRSPGDLRAVIEAWAESRLAPAWAETELLRSVLPALLVDGELRARYRREVLGPSILAVEDFLRRLQAAGRIRPLDVENGARVISATVLGLALLRLLQEEGLSERPADLVGPITDLLLQGLAASPDIL